jgi:glyoxylate reductase
LAKVFVTRMIPESGLTLMKEKGLEIEVSDFDGVLPREILLEKVQGADAILSLLTDRIDAELMDTAGPQLKVIGQFAVGFDNIDLQAAAKRRIVATNTPGVLTEATAELTVALMYAVARRIVEADRCMREGQFKGWAPLMLLGSDLTGKTLGLVGFGRIGQAVARRMQQMKILYHDLNRNSQWEREMGIEYRELNDLLGAADFVSIHVPLTPETRHLMDANRLSLMKKTAYLINTSRGPVVDEIVLVEALKTGQIKGAALDVYEEEPLMAPGLADLTNVVLVPHIGSATEEARSAMSELAAKNILAVLSGQTPLTPILPS